jgi:hypothetical protein
VFFGLRDCDRSVESPPQRVLDFPFYNSKGKASHTTEGTKGEGKEKTQKEKEGGPGAMMFPFSCWQGPAVYR